MRNLFVALMFAGALEYGHSQTPQPPPASAWLDAQTWSAAEKLLQPDTVVVIPVGAALQQHGRHMPLGTDYYIAERLARDVMNATAVMVVPSVTYHFFSSAADYPGATLTLETARDQTVEIVKSLARFGPRRFYALNTSEGAERGLRAAEAMLASDGILLRYSDPAAHIGTHGREAETSALLHIEAKSVDMANADVDQARATAARGKGVLDSMTEAVVSDIDRLRKMAPPAPRALPRRASGPRIPNIAEGRTVSGCSQGDERAIVQLAGWFNAYWTRGDADSIGDLWSKEGDLVHPDGAVERGRDDIRQNRREQFMRKEYGSSKHAVSFGVIRCLSDDVAVVDGKWQLTAVYDSAGNLLPRGEGLLTVVMKKSGGSWLFEAYRYTVTQQGVKPPTMMKKPGYPDKDGRP